MAQEHVNVALEAVGKWSSCRHYQIELAVVVEVAHGYRERNLDDLVRNHVWQCKGVGACEGALAGAQKHADVVLIGRYDVEGAVPVKIADGHGPGAFPDSGLELGLE